MRIARRSSSRCGNNFSHGDKALVGNKGYRKYLRSEGPKFSIDEEKVKWEERFDGKWVLQTDLENLSAEETALQYKQLWMVEEMFRTVKTLLETRPIFHKCDETIRGHVFCSFLALLLRKELQDRLETQGEKLEWAVLLRDLEALQAAEVESEGKRFLLRNDLLRRPPPSSAPSAWRSPRAFRRSRSRPFSYNPIPCGAWCQDAFVSPQRLVETLDTKSCCRRRD